MKLQSTKDLSQHPKYMVIYGQSGYGKTSLVRTLANPARALVLDAECGMGSLASCIPPIASVSLARADDNRLLTESERHERFNEFIRFVQTAECRAQFDVIFIDSLTEVAENILQHFKGKLEGFKMWGDYKDSVKALLKFFRDMDHYTVICTALETREKTDGEEYGPFLPKVGNRSVREELPQFFDLVARLVLDTDGNRRLLCKPTAKSFAKDRYGHLDLTEPPDLAALMAKRKTE